MAPVFLKNCRDSLTKPLTILFNLSLRNGEFLNEWKVSHIIPIHKSGSKQLVSNYRPISKLQIIPKIFEAIVKNKLYDLIKNGLSDVQHGFIRGRSTVTNLAIFSNYCLSNMENGYQVDTIYTDFSKAFDRVDHCVLLQKLEIFGIHSVLLRWIKSYLTERKQAVAIGSKLSKIIFNYSGVPQGSHLGPLLFLIFINDLPDVFLSSSCLLFADDLKIFRSIKSVTDCKLLQSDLEKLYEWCINNNLYLNINKCFFISYSRSRSPTLFNYKIDVSDLRKVYFHKDLGVILDSKMSFNKHYDYIISKSNSLLGFLKRNSNEFSDPYTLKAIYISLIRSVLEYACCIWCPSYDRSINRIESVQRKFTRYAIWKLNWTNGVMPSYEVRCQLIDLSSLRSRRQCYQAMFARDVICNHIDCAPLLELFSIRTPVRSLRVYSFFYIPFHATNYGKFEPISHCSSVFNSIYNQIDLESSRISFKSTVSELLRYTS